MSSDSVLAELMALEPIFHSAEDMNRGRYEQATVPDFWEVGASGTAYDREVVWTVLEQRSEAGVPADWWSSDFRLRHLAGDVYLLTYVMHQGPRITRRATVWERTVTGWRIVYHQGTVVADPGH